MQRAFTLLEAVVVIGVIVALAGVVTPMVHHQLSDAKLGTARSEVNRIASALSQYMSDTRTAPTGKDGRKSFHWLHGGGVCPSGNGFNSGDSCELSALLTENRFDTAGWKGPYLKESPSDPWGSQYLVNVEGFFNSSERVWVISAGPDRKIETSPQATAPAGDDIALMVQ